ncbi:MAG: GNAT family N-acetyltransferase [Candidatus Heimdallarchaeota archaeon]|nr:GNAT family N-acetyltransferase [Candidatus Heimdallarchaeota archaeon]
MDLEIDVLRYIENQKQSFAEAFPKISFQKEKWGFYFEWENSDHYLTNFALITTQPNNQLDEISNWQKQDPDRKIAISSKLGALFPHIKKQFELGIFFRLYKKISSPLLTNTGVKFQSYRTLSKDMNIQDSMNVIAEIENIPESRREEFQRLIGGHLHLFDGVIWTLDNDGSVLSAALTSELEDMEKVIFLDLLSTREKVRHQGHAKGLLQSILAFNKDRDIITMVKKSDASEKLLDSFNFAEIISFNVYS